MENFTPLSALVGGALIGLAAAIYLLGLGRVAGISGIVGGLLRPKADELPTALAFLIGLIVAPRLVAALVARAPARRSALAGRAPDRVTAQRRYAPPGRCGVLRRGMGTARVLPGPRTRRAVLWVEQAARVHRRHDRGHGDLRNERTLA